MGNTATKFRKAVLSGDEALAVQLYESNPQFKEALDPNASYGEAYQHNTALHYAARHAMSRLLRSGPTSTPNRRETGTRQRCMWGASGNVSGLRDEGPESGLHEGEGQNCPQEI
ncbi:Ankyrin repeat and IBR domain-containing protein 1 [Liparis tanakae]|uniref:Ankyrin repeat and IBR domain-containing protein 1 n=1 Tax=Liparis tanakae TaxID=230148 RepID=A0A4Z2E0F3_9TELE|nr:Ankyrin repeat and IBR domain-containing protein 1 [Liparis tanakae]